MSEGTKKLICVNSVVAGLEIASCVTFSVIPPLLLKSGFTESQMSTIFGVGPLLALFTIPIIGRWSDGCTSLWGRRRPFILFFSILLIISLFLIILGQYLVNEPISKNTGMWVIAGSVVLLDFACQVNINPCESLNADTVAYSNQKLGFMIYSGISSFGCCLGYLLSSIDWAYVMSDSDIRTNTGESTSIIIVIILFTISVLITMLTAKEIPFIKKKTTPSSSPSLSSTQPKSGDLGYCSDIEDDFNTSSNSKSHHIRMPHLIYSNKISTMIPNPRDLIRFLLLNIYNIIIIPLQNLKVFILSTPPVLKNLFWADLMSWMAVMAHSMFCTDFVAQVVYNGIPNASIQSNSDQELRIAEDNFDAGVRMGSFGLLLHSITACIFAICGIENLTYMIGMKNIYVYGLISFGISMLFTAIFPNVIVLNLCAAISGLGYAAINTVPNSLITAYHAKPEIYYSNDNDRGFGGDLAIMDSSYLLSQIILSLFLGHIVDATGLPHCYILVASLCSFIAAYLANKYVTFPT